MARKTIRVEIPLGKPEEMLRLGQAIVAKHKADGESSPLNNAKLTKLGAVLDGAGAQNQAAKAADAVAQTARQARDVALGMGPGQSATMKDTALNLITYARDQLLIEHAGNEEALSAYGFNVVIGSAKTPQRTAKKPA